MRKAISTSSLEQQDSCKSKSRLSRCESSICVAPPHPRSILHTPRTIPFPKKTSSILDQPKNRRALELSAIVGGILGRIIAKASPTLVDVKSILSPRAIRSSEESDSAVGSSSIGAVSTIDGKEDAVAVRYCQRDTCRLGVAVSIIQGSDTWSVYFDVVGSHRVVCRGTGAFLANAEKASDTNGLGSGDGRATVLIFEGEDVEKWDLGGTGGVLDDCLCRGGD